MGAWFGLALPTEETRDLLVTAMRSSGGSLTAYPLGDGVLDRRRSRCGRRDVGVHLVHLRPDPGRQVGRASWRPPSSTSVARRRSCRVIGTVRISRRCVTWLAGCRTRSSSREEPSVSRTRSWFRSRTWSSAVEAVAQRGAEREDHDDGALGVRHGDADSARLRVRRPRCAVPVAELSGRLRIGEPAGGCLRHRDSMPTPATRRGRSRSPTRRRCHPAYRRPTATRTRRPTGRPSRRPGRWR